MLRRDARMTGKHDSFPALLFSVAVLVSLFHAVAPPVSAAPAAPGEHLLSQADGSQIFARQWGDEWSHGWETVEGYSIVFDTMSRNWSYAVTGPLGTLVPSVRVVGKDMPPDVPVFLRPSLNARDRAIRRKESSQSGASGVAVSPWGVANIPFILVSFSDRTPSFTPANFQNLLFGIGKGSMKDYYEEVSYGAFSVSPGPGGIRGWYFASQGHDYYGQNDEYGSDKYPATLVREAVKAADRDINFAAYDRDGDCYADVVAIVHQDTGEEAGGPSTDIWSHRWNLASAAFFGDGEGIYTTNDSCAKGGFVKVNDYVIQPEILWGSIHTVGVFAHEYGHVLGLPDLYDTDGSSAGIGNWGLMAGGTWNGVLRSGDSPAHLSAWSKYFLGWSTPTPVSDLLVDEPIAEASSHQDAYQMLAGTPLSGEYFLIENRQKSGFDAGLPGAGLLIWHVDGNRIAARMASNGVNRDECFPGGLPCTKTRHYGVALEQADGRWHLEKNVNRGDAGDPFSAAGNSSLSATTKPGSFLYDGNASGVVITSISDPGPVMTATMGFFVDRVTLLSPQGGEVIPSGSSWPISWEAPPEAVSFTIKYSLNSGSTWKTIARGVTGTSHDWDVPIPRRNARKCLVKVIGYDEAGRRVGADRSEEVFTIEVLRLDTPGSGRSVSGPLPHVITWTTHSVNSPVHSVTLKYTMNGGATWRRIDKVSGNPGFYSWTLPSVAREKRKCRVKILLKDVEGSVVAKDVSDGFFTLSP